MAYIILSKGKKEGIGFAVDVWGNQGKCEDWVFQQGGHLGGGAWQDRKKAPSEVDTIMIGLQKEWKE